ncbi:Uncharacterised protein [Achromobacter xylosoxidans]|jgi:hypothetical protein|nr:Uncharacterised protein [Achromobacter xylosoxidans]
MNGWCFAAGLLLLLCEQPVLAFTIWVIGVLAAV